MQVDPRTVWLHEAHNFTPWLLDNADRLAEALGIDIELEAAEHAVGGYSLDLVGRDITNDAVLIVENQLETTDHSHLGQVLTCAAGTIASTIVWIATAFREEHRQALDWLNENTGEDVHFFGVELQVVKIGDSPPAPLFSLVVQPNDWQKRVRAATQRGAVTGRGALYLQFWPKLLDRVRAQALFRAVAAVESWWHMSVVGNSGTSFGLFQVRQPYHCQGRSCIPMSHDTALNADYYGATLRSYYSGQETWLNTVSGNGSRYPAHDLWGSVGFWSAGHWHVTAGNVYVAKVKRYLRQRVWLGHWF